MKQFLLTMLKGVISLIVLVFMIMLAWSTILAILRTLNNEISNSDVTLVLAIVSAVASVVTLFISKWLDRQTSLFLEAVKVNQPIYEIIINEALQDNVDKKCLKNKHLAFIVSHSSDKIYDAFIDFCDNEENSATHLIRTIREELKLTNKKKK